MMAGTNRHDESHTELATTTAASSNMPIPIPLGWTQVKRPRQNRSSNERTSAETGERACDTMEWTWCCDDPACRRPSSSSDKPHGENNDKEDFSLTTIRGHAVICLHEINPAWCQGYFLVQGQRKPWGLLAVQEELDECLECVDGGYRQATLTVYPYSQRNMTWRNVEWTGGDMMRLTRNINKETNATLSMETHRMLTGQKAVPYIIRYFMSLLRKLRQDDGEQTHQSVLELMPEVAIVVGPMMMKIPKSTKENGGESLHF